jgi:uncharacterized protein
MALEMKKECEKCHQALPANGMAVICSYECTFCEKCAAALKISVRIAAASWSEDPEESRQTAAKIRIP